VEDVHDHLHVIEHDPLAGGKAIDCRRSNPVILFQLGLDFRGDRFELGLRCGRADNKEIREGRDLAQIEDQDIFSLFV